MKQIVEFKENEVFERTLRNNYSEKVSDIVLEWTEEALAYVFKKISDKDLFVLGTINRDDNSIEYIDEEYTVQDVIRRVIIEMEYALDGTENRELIEEEIKILSEAL